MYVCVCQMYVVFCTAVTTNHHRKCDNENDFPHRKWFGQDGNLNRCSFQQHGQNRGEFLVG